MAASSLTASLTALASDAGAVEVLSSAEAQSLLASCEALAERLAQHIDSLSLAECQLLSLPPDVLIRTLALLPSVEDFGRLDCVCRALHNGAAACDGAPSCATASPIEEALRLRAAAGGYAVPAELPEGWSSWTQRLCWDERRRYFVQPAVAAGGMYHSLLIEAGGRLLTCGSTTLDGGRPGLLGHGPSVERLETPQPIPALLGVRIRTVAAAEYHSVGVSEGGAAYSWGYGGLGRLGHGDEADVYSPREMLTPAVVDSLRGTPLRSVAAGTYHSLLLSTTGVVHSCGEGGLGQLGHGDDLSCALSPRAIDALRTAGVVVSAIAAGRLHSLCLSDEGAVYTWGSGDDGRLGHGDCEPCRVPRRISGLAGVRVCALSSSWEHTLCLSDTGRVYSWGLGLCGQLGHGDEEENAISPKLVEELQGEKMASVVAGCHHCLALTVNGCLYGWGVGKTTEEESVDALGLRLQSNQCRPLQYEGLRLARPALVRVASTGAAGARASREVS